MPFCPASKGHPAAHSGQAPPRRAGGARQPRDRGRAIRRLLPAEQAADRRQRHRGPPRAPAAPPPPQPAVPVGREALGSAPGAQQDGERKHGHRPRQGSGRQRHRPRRDRTASTASAEPHPGARPGRRAGDARQPAPGCRPSIPLRNAGPRSRSGMPAPDPAPRSRSLPPRAVQAGPALAGAAPMAAPGAGCCWGGARCPRQPRGTGTGTGTQEGLGNTPVFWLPLDTAPTASALRPQHSQAHRWARSWEGTEPGQLTQTGPKGYSMPHDVSSDIKHKERRRRKGREGIRYLQCLSSGATDVRAEALLPAGKQRITFSLLDLLL